MNDEQPKKARKSHKGAIRSTTAWKGYTPAKGLRVVVRPERRGDGGPKGEAGEIASAHDVEGTKYFSIRFDGKDKPNRPVSLATLLHLYYPESFWKAKARELEAQKMAAVGGFAEQRPTYIAEPPVKLVSEGADAAEKLTRAIWALESTARMLEKAIGVLTGTTSALDVNLNAALVTHGKSLQDSALQVASSLDEVKDFAVRGDSK